MKYLYTLFFTIYAVLIHAQLIETSPHFPTSDERVSIYFRADFGNKGLEGFTGDVYAHTGVITDKSTSPSDWKYVKTTWGQNTPETKLNRIGVDYYVLEIPGSIRAYYGVPMSDQIEQLAFVFRSGTQQNGSYFEAKTETNSDIFVDLYDNTGDYNVKIMSPQNGQVFEINESVDLRIAVSTPAVYTLTIGENAESINIEDLYETELTFSESENIAIVIEGPEESRDEISISIIGEQDIQDPPSGFVLGAENLENGVYRFVLEAPTKGSVFLKGNFSNWLILPENQLKKSQDGRFFWIEQDLSSFDEIQYQYVVDGLSIADPLSELVLDPYNDRFIAPVTFPNMPEYPENQSGDISILYPNQATYQWEVDFQRLPQEKLVIYELLLRDFFVEHDYETLIDTLAYFEKLGINAIQLMPINEFDGNLSWGYNPAYHMALDKYYGNPNSFKRFVDEAHKKGIAVIIDVVFNHATGRSPLASMYWNSSNNTPSAENPWLNPTARHPFNVFHDMNHESESTQKYMDRCIKFMFEEYNIDGMRFDLSKGFTQRLTNDVGEWSAYDASRVAILQRMRDVIRTYSSDAYLILEHLGTETEEVELSEMGYLLWTNLTYNYHQAAKGYHTNGISNLEGSLYHLRGFESPALVTYMESHDEQRMFYEISNYGNSNSDYSARDFLNANERSKAVLTLHYLTPGPKMLWQFGEMGYDFPINYCPNGTINEDCRTSEKPIRWDYYSDEIRRSLYNTTADIIALKSITDIFEEQPAFWNLTNAYKYLVYNNEEEGAVVVANLDIIDRSVTLSFPKRGVFYEYFSGDSITIGALPQSIPLPPGGFKVFTNKKFDKPSDNFPVSIDYWTALEAEVKIYPNPTSTGLINITFSKEINIESIEWYSIDGNRLSINYYHQTIQNLDNQRVPTTPGLYLIKINGRDSSSYHKILVN